MDIKKEIESCKAGIRDAVGTYKPLVEELGKGVHAVAQDVIKDAVDAYGVVRESYGIMGETTEILLECKKAGLTVADKEQHKAGTLDDAVKRGILDRYNEFYGKNHPLGEKNISAAMVGGLLYMILHREALDAQEYHRTNMCSACTRCEGGACDLSDEGSACEPPEDAGE